MTSSNFSWTELNKAIEADFQGFEQMRYDLVYNTPKYGNDDDYADQQAVTVFEIYYDAVNNRPSSRGGVHRINMLPTTSHVYFGSVTGATADGRKAFTPLSEGISPSQGVDNQGPTSVIKSASKIDHLRTGGTLLNQKFSPQFFEDEESYNCLTALDPQLFQPRWASYPVQCRQCRHTARCTEAPGVTQRSDCKGGGIQ